MALLAQHSAFFRFAVALFIGGLLLLGVLAAVGLWFAGRTVLAPDDRARRIVRNSAGPLLIQLFVRAIDLALVKLLFVVLGPSDFGAYNLAGLLVTLYLATLAEWGLGVWLTREVALDPSIASRAFGTAVVLRWLLAVLAVPVAVAISLSYALLQHAGLITNALSHQTLLLIAFLLPSLIPAAFAGATTALFVAHEQPTTIALANLFNNSLATLLQVMLLLLGFGVLGVAAAASISTLLNAGLFAWLLHRSFGWPGLAWDRALALNMLRQSFPLMVNGLLVGVFFTFDRFIIQGARFGGEEAVAAYSAAYKYATLALVLPPIVINALFPLFARQARHDRAALTRGYRQTVRWLLLPALPLATVIAIWAPQAIRIVAEAAYVPAGAPALTLLIWFVPWSYINGVAQYVLIALGRQSTITWAFAVTALFNLLANLVLVPLWGINGAAVVTVLSEMVLFVPFQVVLRRELGPLHLVQVVWRTCVSALCAGGVGYMFRDWGFAALLGGALVYAGLLWLLRAFTAADRTLLARILGKSTAEPVPARAN
ncbi:MAG: flippase [Herpetosiphon sp.]